LPIDVLSYDYKVRDDLLVEMVTSKPIEGGIYLYGIYLEGARWDGRKKCIGWPKAKELYSEFPIMHFIPLENRV